MRLNENTLFSQRLNEALNKNDIPPKGKGRQIVIAKMFRVSQESARKWLEGKAFPDTKRIPLIAKAMNVNVQWLMWGLGHMNSSTVVKELPTEWSLNWIKIPILDWEEAGNFKKVLTSLTHKENINTTWANVAVGPHAYALKVDDDSMEPRYIVGSILVIDPDYQPSHKHIVIYKLKNQKKVTCKQLLIDGESKYLAPHNPSYQTLIIKPGDKYCGSIRQVLMQY